MPPVSRTPGGTCASTVRHRWTPSGEFAPQSASACSTPTARCLESGCSSMAVQGCRSWQSGCCRSRLERPTAASSMSLLSASTALSPERRSRGTSFSRRSSSGFFKVATLAVATPPRPGDWRVPGSTSADAEDRHPDSTPGLNLFGGNHETLIFHARNAALVSCRVGTIPGTR